MPIEITVKPIQMWIMNGGDRKGLLADSIEPVVAAGDDLRVIMAYRFPDQPDRATICVFPPEGRSAEAAARAAGFAVSDLPWLLVQGEERRGIAARIAREIADAGVSAAFFAFQTVHQRFSAVIGLDSEDDAATVRKVIEKLARDFHR